MIDLFRNAQDGGTVDATELADLRSIVANTTLFGALDYVWKLGSYVVSANNPANAKYLGQTLGNLVAGSTARHLENLVGKWFLGLDHPTAVGHVSQFLGHVVRQRRQLHGHPPGRRRRLLLHGVAGRDGAQNAGRHHEFARRRAPGETKLRVYNPQFETHGWQSTHTAVEVVTDDKPFLIDSVTIELNRRRVRRPPDHPSGARRAPGRRRQLGRGAARPSTADSPDEDRAHRRVGDSRGGRPPDRPGTTRGDAGPRAARARRGGRGRRGLAGDARAGAGAWWASCARRRPRASKRRRDRVTRVPRVGRRPQLHLPRLPRLRAVEDDGEDRCGAVAGSGLGMLRESGGESRSAASPSFRPGASADPRAAAARPDQGQLPGHRPSARAISTTSGVKRFDADGRSVGERRFVGLYTSSAYECRPARDADAAAQVGRVVEASGLPARGATTRRRCSRCSRPIRATSSSRVARGAVRDRARHPAPRRAPAAAPVHAPRRASGASTRASCSCRARISTPKTAAASRRSCAT